MNLRMVAWIDVRDPVTLRSSTLPSVLDPRFKSKEGSLGVKSQNHTYSMALS